MYEISAKQTDINRQFSNAIFDWDVEKVKKLFSEENQLKPDINAELVTAPAILLAATIKNWEMFEVLYNLEADLDVKSISKDWHLLHECVKNAPLHITKSIMEYCNLNVQTEDGRTPLMVAIKEKNETVANLLIDSQRASVNLLDKRNNNAAHYAANADLNKIFSKLVKENVNLNVRNKDGKYPVELIKDDMFKMSVPSIKVLKNTPIAASIQELQETKEHQQEIKPSKQDGLTGLSKIKKKF